MYERPELVAAHNRYWNLIRQGLRERSIDSPTELSQQADRFSAWTDPNLVLSQTCGMPYRLWLHDKVNLVGTPDFGVDACPPGYYRSAIVVRRDDEREDIQKFKTAIFAYNQTHSQSGYAAAFTHLKPYGFCFENRLEKGAHVHSARAVADGTADIAALDAVTWRLMERYDGFTRSLRVLDWTEPTPGLPYIAAATADKSLTFAAVEYAIEALEHEDRELLEIRGIVDIPKESYLAIENPNPLGDSKS